MQVMAHDILTSDSSIFLPIGTSHTLIKSARQLHAMILQNLTAKSITLRENASLE